MNRFDLLFLHKMELESSDENRQENQAFSDGETPARTFALAGKAKWLISKARKLLDVLWTETIRIKPETWTFSMFRF